jgi:stress response protein YsnF
MEHSGMENNNIEDNLQKANSPKDFSNPPDVVSEQQQQNQQERVIPVLEEEYSISKEIIVKEARIEKRCLTRTKTLKVPISYEEVYINGKKMKSMEEHQILSLLKDKIRHIGRKSNSDDIFVKQLDKSKKGGGADDEDRGEVVPLMSPSSDNNTTTLENEKVISLCAEEIEVTKKMVKVADQKKKSY